MVRTSRVLIAIAAAGLLLSACTTKTTERPPLAGPSELALSLSLSASPDILTQDGTAQSRIVILARDANGAAVKGLPLHVEIAVNGSVLEYGHLSSQDVTTGNDGRATLTYTPPPATSTTDEGTIVTIRVTPTGTDYGNSVPRSVSIRLVPPGYVPAGPVASFTFTPTSGVPNSAVSFDGSSSTCPTATITDYTWDFGDSATGTGKTPQHTYRAAGSYQVTLIVADSQGRVSNPVTQTINVANPMAPTANFVISPTMPAPGQTIYLNASSSTPGTGRTLVSFAWDFGNGSTGQGMTTTTSYAATGTYTITLVVTDDVGQTATRSQSVSVSSTGSTTPTANFVYSPTAPSVNQSILFDASTSTAATGHTIATYTWTFGDGSTGTGRTYTKTAGYATAATYNVVLTVTDDLGQSATKATTITIGGGGGTPVPPTAAFVFSPTAPAVGQNILFDASTSTAASGHAITSYAWTFGDGSAATGQTYTKSGGYSSAGSYNVMLTVTDDLGQTKSTSQVVTVGSALVPTASFAVSPSPASVGSTVVVDASTSTTSVGQTITTYEWNFGDTVTIETTSNRTYSHVYATAGTYTITLTITDSIGRKASTTKSLTVNP